MRMTNRLRRTQCIQFERNALHPVLETILHLCQTESNSRDGNVKCHKFATFPSMPPTPQQNCVREMCFIVIPKARIQSQFQNWPNEIFGTVPSQKVSLSIPAVVKSQSVIHLHDRAIQWLLLASPLPFRSLPYPRFFYPNPNQLILFIQTRKML